LWKEVLLLDGIFVPLSYNTLCIHHKFGVFLFVKGPDWQWKDQDGGPGSVGVVYSVKADATIYVRLTLIWA
jgi:hypothetical protein